LTMKYIHEVTKMGEVWSGLLKRVDRDNRTRTITILGDMEHEGLVRQALKKAEKRDRKFPQVHGHNPAQWEIRNADRIKQALDNAGIKKRKDAIIVVKGDKISARSKLV
jgi:hypothetical protein